MSKNVWELASGSFAISGSWFMISGSSTLSGVEILKVSKVPVNNIVGFVYNDDDNAYYFLGHF